MNKNIGEISLHKKGFGFVIGENEKYFIAEKNLKGSANKDVVSYEVVMYKGRPEAIVKEVIKRNTNEFVGRILNSSKFSFVETNELSKDIYISSKHTKNAKNNDMVKVLVKDFGDKDRKPEGIVIKVYGSNVDATSIVNAKIDELNIQRKFSKEILNYTDSIALFNLEDELNKRIDLRDIKHITIDGADTKDIDDAIALEKDENKYNLYVSIADVSYFVKEKDILDDLAKTRGNSIYLYDRVIPMLPRRLTNDLCSLNPNENKLAYTAKITLDENAKVIDVNIFKSVIKSYRKFSYDEVNDILLNNKEDEFLETLKEMDNISLKLDEISRSRNSMEFVIPELKLILDEKQNLVEIKLRNSGKSESMIENFMVLANEEVAKYMFYNNIPSIYRVHEKPSLESMTILNEELKAIGMAVKSPDKLSKRLQKIIEATKNEKYGFAIHKLILRSMQKAVYSNRNDGHFGLALDNYLHFTSPIRRYSDLIVHRLLDKSQNMYITDFEKKKIDKRLKSISEHISKTERVAQKLENDAIDIKISEYMQKYINEKYMARVTSVHNERVFVTLENYVEAELLSNKKYELNQDVNVVLTNVDIQNGKIYVEEV